MAAIRRLLLDAAADPFLAESVRRAPEALTEPYGLSAEEIAVLATRKSEVVRDALSDVFAPAHPAMEHELLRIGIGVFLWPDFLSAAECAAMRREAVRAASTKASVGKGPETEADPDVWRARIGALPTRPMMLVTERLSVLAPIVAAHLGEDLAELEAPRVVIYERGGYFRPHIDNIGHPLQPDPARRRRVSVLVFLNNAATKATGQTTKSVCKGGSLRLFRSGSFDEHGHEAWDLEPQRGLLVAYRSSQWSEVRPVTNGQSYALMAWMLGRPLVTPRGESIPENGL